MHRLDRGLSRPDPPADRGLGPGAGEFGTRQPASGGASRGEARVIASLDLGTAGGMAAALAPELTLSTWALVLTVYAGMRNRTPEDQLRAGWLALSGLVATLVVVGYMWAGDVRSSGQPFMMALDGFRWGTTTVFLLGAILTVLISLSYVDRERLWAPEYYVLLLLATVGMMFMGGGLD